MSPTASSPGPLKPLQLEQENIYGTNDELDEAYLNGLLQNEQTILQALTQALGEEKGKEQVIDSMSMSLKASKKEYLIDEWKRRSSLFPESEKPQPVPLVSSDADPRSVEAALTGQWRALRFVAAGEEMPDEARSMIRLTFADGKYVLMMGPNVETGTYQIDASRQPFGITITVGSGTDQGRIRRGSFKLLKDDQLLTVFSTNRYGPGNQVRIDGRKSIIAGGIREGGVGRRHGLQCRTCSADQLDELVVALGSVRVASSTAPLRRRDACC